MEYKHFNNLILQWCKHNGNGTKNGTNLSFPISFSSKVYNTVGCYHGDTTTGSSGPLAIYNNNKSTYSYYGSDTYKSDYKHFIAIGI